MTLFSYLKYHLLASNELSLMLFKIMLPIIVVIKILKEFGFIAVLSSGLEPVMTLVGLPGAMGLVWATAMMSNLYGGIVVFASLAADNPMSLAQVTVVSSMMLMAHSLPIEVRVAQKVGVRIGFTLAMRIGMAIVFAWILNHLYQLGGWLQQPVTLLWTAEIATPSLAQWAVDQLINFSLIYAIVFVLVVTLDVLKRLYILKWMTFILRPFLRQLGIGKAGETITLVGLTLGLSYGGALMIKEVEKNHVSPREVLYSVTLLGLSHSVIEDTLLMMLISADLSGILIARLVFSFIIIYLLVTLTKRLSNAVMQRYFLHSRN